jgi:predicted acetyltransferase
VRGFCNNLRARARKLLQKRNIMDITLIPASPSDKPVLRRLLELCQHDYSEFNGEDVDEHGIFGYRYLDHYWTDPGRYAFLVRVSGNLAGFILIRELNPDTRGITHSIAEFFILRKYRRQGIGQAVAFMVFDQYPGQWKVSQEQDNLPAQAFWRQVIQNYTGGEYKEIQRPDWDGPTQTFTSPRNP